MPGFDQQSATKPIGEEWGVVVLDDAGKVQRITPIRAQSREGINQQMDELGATPVNVRFAVAHITLHELSKPGQMLEHAAGGAGAFANLARTVTR